MSERAWIHLLPVFQPFKGIGSNTHDKSGCYSRPLIYRGATSNPMSMLHVHGIANAIGNSSGLLTTFGGSQEFSAAGLAAAGCQARSTK